MPKLQKINPEYTPSVITNYPEETIEDAAHHAMPLMPMDQPKKKGKKKKKKSKR